MGTGNQDTDAHARRVARQPAGLEVAEKLAAGNPRAVALILDKREPVVASGEAFRSPEGERLPGVPADHVGRGADPERAVRLDKQLGCDPAAELALAFLALLLSRDLMED